MALEAVARRYAEALFVLARERNQVGGVREELERLAARAGGDPRWRWVLESPVLPGSARESALDQLLGEEASPLVRRFLHVVVRKGRGSLLPAMAREYGRMADEAEGIREAEVTTAMALDEASREVLLRRLESWAGERVRLRERVDPAILGGLIVRVGDRRMDGSVRTRLEAMRRHLAGAEAVSGAVSGAASGGADERGVSGR
ncbi:MAG: ATP synthase F1 subunit delta [Firmicutes bacterium]|nr:ATP synthase F1 subunit delta [Bacillota bacterium]